MGSNFDITQSLGGGSSFDTQKIITSLVAVKQVPITSVETKKTNSETKLTSLGTIVSEVQSLKATFENFAELGPIDYTSLTTVNGFTVTAKAGIAETSYGIDFPSIINKENIYGLQFHPEKSSNQGLDIIKSFIEL